MSRVSILAAKSGILSDFSKKCSRKMQNTATRLGARSVIFLLVDLGLSLDPFSKVHCIYFNRNRVRRTDNSHANKPQRGKMSVFPFIVLNKQMDTNKHE